MTHKIIECIIRGYSIITNKKGGTYPTYDSTFRFHFRFTAPVFYLLISSSISFCARFRDSSTGKNPISTFSTAIPTIFKNLISSNALSESAGILLVCDLLKQSFDNSSQGNTSMISYFLYVCTEEETRASAASWEEHSVGTVCRSRRTPYH